MARADVADAQKVCTAGARAQCAPSLIEASSYERIQAPALYSNFIFLFCQYLPIGPFLLDTRQI